jgi:hypothetical protein
LALPLFDLITVNRSFDQSKKKTSTAATPPADLSPAAS